MMKQGPVEFYEVQRFRHWWGWVLLLGVDALMLWGVIQQLLFGKPWGTDPTSDTALVITAVVIIALSIALLRSKLITYIDAEGVYVKYFPFHLRYKRYDWNNISSVYLRRYSPLREYGGWGFRVSLKSGRAYNMSGNQGLQLVLMNGRRVLVGTRQPEQLADILVKLGKMKE